MTIAVDLSNEFQPQAGKKRDHSWESGSSRTSVTSTESSDSHVSAPLSPDRYVKCEAKQTAQRALLNLELRRLQSFRNRKGVSRREAACIARALTNAAALSTSSTIRDLSFYDAVLDLATGIQTRPHSETPVEMCPKKKSAEVGNEMSLTEMIRCLADNSTAIAQRQNDEILCLRLVVKGLVSELLNVGRSPSDCCAEALRYPNVIEILKNSEIKFIPSETGQSVEPSPNRSLSCSKCEQPDREGLLPLHERLVECDALNGSKMQEHKCTQQSADTVVDIFQSVPGCEQQSRTLTDAPEIQNEASTLSRAADLQANNYKSFDSDSCAAGCQDIKKKLSEQDSTRAQSFQPTYPSTSSLSFNKTKRSPLDYLYEITADDDSDDSVDALDRVESGIQDPKMSAIPRSKFGDTTASAEAVSNSESFRVEKDDFITRHAKIGSQQQLMDTRQEEVPHQDLIFENTPPSSKKIPQDLGPCRKTLTGTEGTHHSYTRDERRLLFDGSLEADESTCGSFMTAASEASSPSYTSSRLLDDEFKMDCLASTNQRARHFSKPVVREDLANPKTDLNELECAIASLVGEQAATADVFILREGSLSDSTWCDSAEQGDSVEDHYISRKEDSNVSIYSIVQERHTVETDALKNIEAMINAYQLSRNTTQVPSDAKDRDTHLHGSFQGSNCFNPPPNSSCSLSENESFRFEKSPLSPAKCSEGQDAVPATLVSFELLAPHENLDGCKELLSVSASSKTILLVNGFERNLSNVNLEIESSRERLQETLPAIEALQQDVSTETTMPTEQDLTPFDRVMLFFEETQRIPRQSRKSSLWHDRALPSMMDSAEEPLANEDMGVLDAPQVSDPQPIFTAIAGLDRSVNLQGLRRPVARSSEQTSMAKSIGLTRQSPSIPSQRKRKEFVRFNISPSDAGSGTYAFEPDSNLRARDSRAVHSDSVSVSDDAVRVSECAKTVESDDNIGTNRIEMIHAFLTHRQPGPQRLAGKSQADAGDSPPSTPTRPTSWRRLVHFQDCKKESGVPDRHFVETSLVLREGEEDIWTGGTVKNLKPRPLASLAFRTKTRPVEQHQHSQERQQEVDGKPRLASEAGDMDMSPREGANPASGKKHFSPEIRALIELSSRLDPGALEQYI
jgi:hypothetical protein